MNKPQRSLTWVILALFAASLIFAPITTRSTSLAFGGYTSTSSSVGPVFFVGADDSIRFEILALEWIGLAVLYAGLFFVFRKGTS